METISCSNKYSLDSSALCCILWRGWRSSKLLLDAADNNTWALLDMRNSYGCTALHEATGCTLSPEARDEVAKLLLNAAGDNIWNILTRQSNDDWTALHFAARYGRTKITQFLLDTAGDRTKILLTYVTFWAKPHLILLLQKHKKSCCSIFTKIINK